MKIKSDMRQAAVDQRGIALVITLILLSVTLVMAIAFLAISNRERGSVTTSTETVTARLAADAALAKAQAQIIATIYATTNPYTASLIVSTNYRNDYGFVNNNTSPTNVNYDFTSAIPPQNLTPGQVEQNIANLLYLPRAPVYVTTNQQTGAGEFRFYLDLNRNGRFEDTRSDVPEVDNFGNTNGFFPQTGDPQWIGILERPDVVHGPNNKFLSRYAFIAMPADGSLDLNAIHNQVYNTGLGLTDGYFRNQGIGSWEINLAAFLADLNTNQWDPTPANFYQYNPPPLIGGNNGYAFEDARALLAYRYNYDYNSLQFASSVLSANLLPGSIDIFPFGAPLMTNTATPFYNPNLGNRWAGSDNTNHYFAIASDLFDTSKIAPANFINHLELAGGTNSTYDRYTFYRMLAQLGTDSAPEQNKINLNYSNAAASFTFANNAGGILVSGVLLTNIVVFPNAETNLVPWQPLQFFTIAADRMLRDYSARWFQSDPSNYLATYYGIYTNYYYTDANSNIHTNDAGGLGLTARLGVPNVLGLTSDRVPSFGITNIPVLVNGQFTYTPAVQRVLQLAANMFDATTNKTAAYGKNFPSVFRPVLYKTIIGSVTNVSIVGYQDVASYFERFGGLTAGNSPLDLPLDIYSLRTGYTPANPLSVIAPSGNVYGVPWIIGAKKGFPNFNEFSMQDVVQVTRKLQVTRPSTNSLPTATNQMYVVSVTNYLGVEFWNSYTNGYTNNASPIQVVVRDNLTMQMALTNGSVLTANGLLLSGDYPLGSSSSFNVWPSNTFLVPFATNFNFLAASAYYFAAPSFYYVGDNPNNYAKFLPTTPTFAPLPQLQLQVTNHLQAFILNDNHVIDYVHFSGPGSTRNLNSEFQNTNTSLANGGTAAYYTNLIWSTVPDKSGVIPLGIATQIGISAGFIPLDTFFWKIGNGVSLKDIHNQIDGFRHFLNPGYASLYGAGNLYSTNLEVQVPYGPSVTIYEYDTYQANDPLVHYLKSDLNYLGYDPDASSGVHTGTNQVPGTTAGLILLPDLGKINARYQPWGINPPSGQRGVSTATYDENPYSLAFKDPLMTRPDNWDFPVEKLPTVGWLGRVHRGTPWQTVYLKASNVLKETVQVGGQLYNIGTNTWAVWTGDTLNTYHSADSAPIQDRLLFDNFTTALNDNATRGQLSVNAGANGHPSLAAWSAVFSGVVAISNATFMSQYYHPATNNYNWFIINPAGPSGTNSILGRLVAGINNSRAQFINANGVVGTYEHVGDILSTPQFTEQSPFLHVSNFVNNVWVEDSPQKDYGISDEVYEWLPQQTMSLLRVDNAPRYVIYSYGQTLKPAANGVVSSALSPSFFGMVTNYQVVAETATRAVVQVRPVITTNPNGTLSTNYNLKIEQFNVLPPD